MANCLYYKNNPIGIVQSNADDVLYGGGLSVKDKIDSIDSRINEVVASITDINIRLSKALIANSSGHPGTNDFNNFDKHSFVWANNTSGTMLNAPTANAFNVFTMETYPDRILQIAFQFTSQIVYIRSKSDENTWTAGKSITVNT